MRFLLADSHAANVCSEGLRRRATFADYFPKGVRWQLPDLHRSAKAYMLARMAFGGDARQVVDATEGGKLEAFSKVDFATLFEN